VTIVDGLTFLDTAFPQGGWRLQELLETGNRIRIVRELGAIAWSATVYDLRSGVALRRLDGAATGTEVLLQTDAGIAPRDGPRPRSSRTP
jgi:hypothetical protein